MFSQSPFLSNLSLQVGKCWQLLSKWSGCVKCVRHHHSIPCSTWGFGSSSETSVKISRPSQSFSFLFLQIFSNISVKSSPSEHLVLKHQKKGNLFGSKHISSIPEHSQRGLEQQEHPWLGQMPPLNPSLVICSFHPCASDRKGGGFVDEHRTDSSHLILCLWAICCSLSMWNVLQGSI